MTDATGLAVRVSPNSAKTWVWRYRFGGKQKRLTLGSYPAMSLGEARGKLGHAQEKLEKGFDPADDRPSHRAGGGTAVAGGCASGARARAAR